MANTSDTLACPGRRLAEAVRSGRSSCDREPAGQLGEVSGHVSGSVYPFLTQPRQLPWCVYASDYPRMSASPVCKVGKRYV